LFWGDFGKRVLRGAFDEEESWIDRSADISKNNFKSTGFKITIIS
jgi:hypothetical protein